MDEDVWRRSDEAVKDGNLMESKVDLAFKFNRKVVEEVLIGESLRGATENDLGFDRVIEKVAMVRELKNGLLCS